MRIIGQIFFTLKSMQDKKQSHMKILTYMIVPNKQNLQIDSLNLNVFSKHTLM